MIFATTLLSSYLTTTNSFTKQILLLHTTDGDSNLESVCHFLPWYNSLYRKKDSIYEQDNTGSLIMILSYFKLDNEVVLQFEDLQYTFLLFQLHSSHKMEVQKERNTTKHTMFIQLIKQSTLLRGSFY